uniref:NADH dehydrogenase subunit 5 n=1 Tax=Amblyomma maculatum TaxID=34609 RepID=UPI00223869C9|nr:NADH dehydrogenase subunit 5 [Amblyomma maculatum]UYB77945.1 NADH dehydrogenase subunit 5 [Amblyomma maculatum]
MFVYWGTFLLLVSFIFVILYFYTFSLSNTIVMEYFMISMLNIDFKFYFLFDWMSTMFSAVVTMISGLVIIYSNSYMKNELNKNSFCLVVLLFVLSMLFLILMPNIFMIILGWDGLGLVSYCLVIYYQSVNSYNSGMMTIISNRVGDVMIILAMIFFINFGSFDLMTMTKIELICGILILIAGLTKSAQIPFSAWLPAAMAAPTPVSALVHSSTLVTAGVYLLMRFNFLFMNSFYSNILLKISLLTLMMSGINAFFECDMKKIIAFSTLSQLSMMMISLSIGMMEVAFFHLILHAIFKSMLFLCAGLVIHYLNGIQDIRMLGNFFNFSPMISSCMLISILSLIGFPFIGGFYSKDMIVEFFFFKMNNCMLLIFFLTGIMFTFLYCYRMIYILYLKGVMNLHFLKFNFDFYMNFSIFILCLLMIVIGNLLFWFLNPNFSIVFIHMFPKHITLMLMVFVLFFFYNIYNFSNSKNLNLDFFYKIWHLSFLSSYIVLSNNKTFIKISMSDWTWMETLGPKNFNFSMANFLNFNYWIEKKNLSKLVMMLLLMMFMFII